MAADLPTAPTRAELVVLICDLITEAKMPPSRKRSKFVIVPKEIIDRAASIVRRESRIAQGGDDGQ